MTDQQQWFKERSLELLANSLNQMNYPGYPTQKERLFDESKLLEPGSWWTEERPTQELPLHPWYPEMIRNKSIGVLAGRGFYYHYGPNHTADPIVTRHDLDEPHVLLIDRKDTGHKALPGGFVDPGERPYVAAIREAIEETRFNLHITPYEARKVYDGPLADLRVTAHAWPHTTAYHFKLDRIATKDLSTDSYPGSDDAKMVHWVPESQLTDKLFGSHLLLALLALRE